MENYHQTLGIDRHATPDAIKKAYKKLAMTHHPDRGGDPNQFKKITEAYERLISGLDTKNKESFWSEEFADRFRRYKQSIRAHHVQLHVTLEQVHQRHTLLVAVDAVAYSVVIPPGVETGDQYRFGNASEETPLTVTFIVKNHPRFVRDGLNLITTVPVPTLELLVGTTVRVTDIEGRQFNLNIPSCTGSETLFKMPGLGLPGQTKTGDMIVKVKSIMPKTITAELKQAILTEVHNKEEEPHADAS